MPIGILTRSRSIVGIVSFGCSRVGFITGSRFVTGSRLLCCLQVVLASGEVIICLSLLRYGISPPLLYYTSGSLSLTRLFKMFLQNSYFVGHLESASLRAEISVEIRLPTSRSPQTLRKQDPHWKLWLLLL